MAASASWLLTQWWDTIGGQGRDARTVSLLPLMALTVSVPPAGPAGPQWVAMACAGPSVGVGTIPDQAPFRVVLGVMYRVNMKSMHRLATLGDAERLFELRRKSIIALAPKGMSLAQAQLWAGNLTVAGMIMKRKIREMEIWIVELNDTAVGWSAIRGDRLKGLYIDPEFVGRGIGTELLGVLEGLIRERGILAVQAEASSNAEEFYFRRGYEPIGLRTPEGALPITKRLL